MSVSVPALAVRLRDRVERKGAGHGLAYSWWIAAIGAGGQVGAATLAVLQRDALVPPGLLALAVVLVVLPHAVQYVVRPWVPWWVDAVLVLGATLWLMSVPMETRGPENLAPAVAVFLVACVTATDGGRAGLAVTGAATAVVLLGDRIGGGYDPALDIYVMEILLGFLVGAILRSQMRALAAERRDRDRERERAALAERQRIAREIHDLVAHSLSVTMLQVTGARQALVEDGDVDEAVAALTDAERVGRQAMGEIRRTVGVLSTEPSGAHPLPCAEDVDALVAQVRDAGMEVDYLGRGDLTRLAPSTGLGLYRVLQESLTNVAKHAPGEAAEVRVVVGRRHATLTVRNRTVPGRDLEPGGSGTAGMAARVEQLGGNLVAGPDDRDPGRWLVRMSVPVGGPVVTPGRGGTREADPPASCRARRALT